MTQGILLVQSRPASEQVAAEYHRWYDETHIPEILAIEGFVSARRFEALDGESFIAMYEIEGDVAEAKASLGAAQTSGSMSPPVGLQLNPPPTVQYFREVGAARA